MANKKRRGNGKHVSAVLQSNKKAFLEAFGRLGTITHAAKAVNICRDAHYEWMREDPEYPALFDGAIETFNDSLNREIFKRGVEEKSDVLLIFAAKGAMPERYKDRQSLEHSGPSGGPIQVDAVRRQLLADEQVRDAAKKKYLERFGKQRR